MSDNDRQLARQTPAPIEVFADEMRNTVARAARASGGRLQAEQIGQIVVHTVRRTPILAAAILTPRGRQSMHEAVIDAATLGLIPSGKYGGGYLLPFVRQRGTENEWTEVVFVPDYRALARATERALGDGWRVKAEAVYENDKADIKPGGVRPTLEHDYDVNAPPQARGQLVGAYAVAFPPHETSRPMWRYCPAWEIVDRHEKRSRGAFNRDGSPNMDSPWRTDRDTQFKKTAIRVFASEMLDASEEVKRFLAAADRETDFGDTPEATVIVRPPQEQAQAHAVVIEPRRPRMTDVAAKVAATTVHVGTGQPPQPPAVAEDIIKTRPATLAVPEAKPLSRQHVGEFPAVQQQDIGRAEQVTLSLAFGGDTTAPVTTEEPPHPAAEHDDEQQGTKPQAKKATPPVRDEHPAWPMPVCILCRSFERVTKARATKNGDYECMGPAHEKERHMRRATDAEYVTWNGKFETLQPSDREVIMDMLRGDEFPGMRQWSGDHMKRANAIYDEFMNGTK